MKPKSIFVREPSFLDLLELDNYVCVQRFHNFTTIPVRCQRKNSALFDSTTIWTHCIQHWVLIITRCCGLVLHCFSLPVLQVHHFHRQDHYGLILLHVPNTVFTESDKSCNLHTHVVWFTSGVKRKWFDQKGCLVFLRFNCGRKPTKSKPTWMFRCSRAKSTPDNLLFCCFFLRGSVFCSTRRSEGGERMPNKAAEGMHSQEVRVRL